MLTQGTENKTCIRCGKTKPAWRFRQKKNPNLCDLCKSEQDAKYRAKKRAENPNWGKEVRARQRERRKNIRAWGAEVVAAKKQSRREFSPLVGVHHR